ncbi:MAG: cytochrome c oxidase assembly protein [Casimicrobiaceae bacterium]|nr:cytochrome c oxidase assembly protein [Casimicrobiaceae bacterium]
MNWVDLANRLTLRKLIVFAAVMFAFGFALVPIYQKICEVTRINDLLRPDEVKNTQVDPTRTIRVEFDANTRASGGWTFKPEVTALDVHPGELTTVVYEITNTAARPMVGQAIPSYMPLVAAEHFKKLECFCFTKQAFAANETRKMPVVFVLDPKLPRDVNTITLSYTFFELPGGSAPTPTREPGGKLSAGLDASSLGSERPISNPLNHREISKHAL